MCFHYFEIYTCSGMVINPDWDPNLGPIKHNEAMLDCKGPISATVIEFGNPIQGEPHPSDQRVKDKEPCRAAKLKGLEHKDIVDKRMCKEALAPRQMAQVRDTRGRFCVLHEKQDRLRKELEAVQQQIIQQNQTLTENRAKGGPGPAQSSKYTNQSDPGFAATARARQQGAAAALASMRGEFANSGGYAHGQSLTGTKVSEWASTSNRKNKEADPQTPKFKLSLSDPDNISGAPRASSPKPRPGAVVKRKATSDLEVPQRPAHEGEESLPGYAGSKSEATSDPHTKRPHKSKPSVDSMDYQKDPSSGNAPQQGGR